jgi:hypothetical protein
MTELKKLFNEILELFKEKDIEINYLREQIRKLENRLLRIAKEKNKSD